jgi:hypothetical protein
MKQVALALTLLMIALLWANFRQRDPVCQPELQQELLCASITSSVRLQAELLAGVPPPLWTAEREATVQSLLLSLRGCVHDPADVDAVWQGTAERPDLIMVLRRAMAVVAKEGKGAIDDDRRHD